MAINLSAKRHTNPKNYLQIVTALFLCGIGAELLAAYSDSTGNIGEILFSLVFFAGLYGAPALLARELIRRLGGGWPSLLLIFAALGVTQACVIDQSIFSADYSGYTGWEETFSATFIPLFGVSTFNTVSFLLGHIAYSFSAPIALAEAMRQGRAKSPWLGKVGTLILGIFYLFIAGVVIAQPESHSATPTQLAVSVVIVLLLTVASIILAKAKRPVAKIGTSEPNSIKIFLVSLLAGVVTALPEADWTGVVVVVTGWLVFGVFLWMQSRKFNFGIKQAALIALGILFSRGLLAFTYFPLVAEVISPVAKYGHNIVMLLILLVFGYFALKHGTKS